MSRKQPRPKIEFGEFAFNPVSGNQDEEFIQLMNPNDTAVDISGWQLAGGVTHTFHPGTVIPAHGAMYVTPSINAFRSRATGPSGGQGLLVQGEYSGHLSNRGETVRLIAGDQTVVAEMMTPVTPSDAQKFLRITEIMYHPTDPPDGSPWDDNDFEFIEVANISDDVTINLENVHFSDGIEFVFPSLQLAPGEHIVAARNMEAFRERYGVGIRVAGEYDGSLSNAGERLRLDDASGSTVVDFVFDDGEPWPQSADGSGASLVSRDPSATPFDEFDRAEHWQASSGQDGTPGRAEPTVSHPGDSNLDGAFNQDDLSIVLQAGKYLSGQPATYGEGDWNRDGKFDQLDIVFALLRGSFVRT